MAFTPSLYEQRAAAQNRADAMREAYSKSKRAKGFTVPITTATSSFNVDLSGMATHFLGFAFFFTAAPAAAITTQLVINNDVVVDSTIINHFRVDGANSPRDYYAFPRPLNGQDSIVFNFNNTTGGQVSGFLVVYYI